MKLDDLDRILLSEKPITPSSSFAGNVMSRIQAQASPRFQLPFPWIPFVLIALSLVILSVLFVPADPILRATNRLTYTLSEWILSPADLPLRNAILPAVASLFGTLMLIWLSFRLTGAKR
jgi:hypothetical protein